MTKVICDLNCGNSPRAALLRDFNVAFAKGDLDAMLSILDDNIVWEMMGHKTFEGKAAVTEMLKGIMGQGESDEYELLSIITHGAEAACKGTVRSSDGSMIAFADFYRFVSASKNGIKRIVSYAIDLSEDSAS